RPGADPHRRRRRRHRHGPAPRARRPDRQAPRHRRPRRTLRAARLMNDLLPLLAAVPLLGAALLVAVGRRLPRVAAESAGCAVTAATAGLALVLLGSSPPMTEWVGGWTPVDGHSVGIVL